jgi:poly(3-hydroxybutyrate) depolymerase
VRFCDPVLVPHPFHDREGDDSVDWPFYEAVMTWLETRFCFDEHRVFVTGNSGGSWFANELACQYANDPQFPIRGIGANTGGLPTDSAHRPTCNDEPLAGIWVHEVGDSTNPFSGNIVAINRAMEVNGCTGSDYNTASFQNYPIGGGQADTTCRRILGCPADYPLVVCALAGNGHGSHPEVVDPGFYTLFESLFAD